MSIAAVSSLSIFQELQSFYQNRQTDLKQLGSALQSGDLAGAQQAYSELAVLGEGRPFANSEPFSKTGRVQATPSARPCKPATWRALRHPSQRLPATKARRERNLMAFSIGSFCTVLQICRTI